MARTKNKRERERKKAYLKKHWGEKSSSVSFTSFLKKIHQSVRSVFKKIGERKKLHLLQLGLFLFILLFTGISIHLINREAGRRIEKNRVAILRHFKETYGVSIQYESLSPAILFSLQVKNLQVQKKGDEGEWSLISKKAYLFYSPFRLLKPGREALPLKLIKKLVLVRGDITIGELEAGNDVDFIKLFESKKKLPLFDVIVKDSTLKIDDLKAQSLIVMQRLSLLPRKKEYLLKVKMEQHIVIKGEAPPIQDISYRLKANGTISRNKDQMIIEGKLKDIRSNVVNMNNLKVSLHIDGDQLRVIFPQEENPFFAEYHYNGKSETEHFQFNSKNLVMGRVFTPQEDFPKILNPWLGTIVNGDFSLNRDVETTRIDYICDSAIILRNDNIEDDFSTFIDFEGDNEIVRFNKFNISSRLGKVVYNGTLSLTDLAPTGKLDLRDIQTPFDYTVTSVFNLSYENAYIIADAEFLSAGDLSFDDTKIIISKGDEAISGSFYTVLNDISRENPCGIFLSALYSNDASKKLSLSFDLTNCNLRDGLLMAGVQTPSVTENYTSNIRLAYEYDFSSFQWDGYIDQCEVYDNNNDQNRFSATGSIGSEIIAISSVELLYNGNVYGGGIYGVNRASETELTLNFSDLTNFYSINFLYLYDDKLIVSGSHEISGLMRIIDDQNKTFSLRTGDMPLLVNDTEISTKLNISGRYEKGQWSCFFKDNTFTIGEEDYNNTSRLTVSGTVDPDRLKLYSIDFADNIAPLRGNALFQYGGEDVVGWINMRDPTGSEAEEFRLVSHYNNNDLDLFLYTRGFSVGRFRIPDLSGRVNASVEILDFFEDARISGAVSTDEVYWFGKELNIQSNLTFDKKGLKLSDLALGYGDALIYNGLLFYTLADEKIRMAADVRLMKEERALNSSFAFLGASPEEALAEGVSLGFGQDTFSPVESFVRKIQTIPQGDFLGNFLWAPVTWGEEELPVLDEQRYILSKQGTKFSFYNEDKESMFCLYNTESGDYSLRLGEPYPLQMESNGYVKLLTNEIYSKTEDIFFDIPFMNYFIPKDLYLNDNVVVFKEGRVDGDILIEGALDNPTFDGEVKIKELLLDTPYTYGKIKETSATIVFKDKEVRLDTMRIPIGNDSVVVDGNCWLERWVPVDYTVNCQMKPNRGNHGISAYYPLMGFEMNGELSGDLKLSGDNKRMDLTGHVTFPQLEMWRGEAPDVKEAARPGSAPFDFVLDLDLETGNNGTFYLPNRKNRIVEANFTPGEILNIHYEPMGQILKVTGDLSIKSGDIFYFGKQFYLKEGSVSFNETMENFNPYLYLEAEVRTKDIENDEIIVSLKYEAPIASEFTPRLTSNPVKSQNEILTLLGQSFTPYDTESGEEVTLTLRTMASLVIGPSLILPISDTVQESLKVDVFNFRTEVIEKALLERYFNEDGESDELLNLGNSSLTLGRYLDNTSFYMGKYLTENLFLSGFLLFEEAEAGEKGNNILDEQDLKASLALNLELTTPYFIVEWTYEPGSSEHFVADNSITLKWKYQY